MKSESPKKRPAKRSRRTAVLYALACLVVPFALAVIVVAGATRWLPEGRAGIDHIVVPLAVFPVIWIAFVIPLYSASRRARAWTIVWGLSIVHAGLVAFGFVR